MESQRIIVIAPDGYRVEAHPVLDVALLQSLVGGYFELVTFTATTRAYINEDGKPEQLPANLLATVLCSELQVGLMPGDVVVGNMVVTHYTSDGNDIGLTPSELAQYEERLKGIVERWAELIAAPSDSLAMLIRWVGTADGMPPI